METKTYCHYFNNNKVCPFNDIGCMFKHSESDKCRFGENCQFKLCQFRHHKKAEDFECDLCHFKSSKKEELAEHKTTNHKYQKFEDMEEWEKYEVNDYMCGYICWQGYHKCFEKQEENDFLGVDVEKVKEDFRNCVFEDTYKCEMCAFKSKAMEKVRTHFLDTHKENYSIKCRECGETLKTISELRKHIGTYHYTPES